jgi:hypothetical protein
MKWLFSLYWEKLFVIISTMFVQYHRSHIDCNYKSIFISYQGFITYLRMVQIVCPENTSMVLVVWIEFVADSWNKAFSSCKTCVVDADKSLISVYENNLTRTKNLGRKLFWVKKYQQKKIKRSIYWRYVTVTDVKNQAVNRRFVAKTNHPGSVWLRGAMTKCPWAPNSTVTLPTFHNADG